MMKLIIILAFAAVPFVYVAIVALAGRKGSAARAYQAARRSHDATLTEGKDELERIEAAKQRYQASLDDMSAWLGG